jgi:hypothetical protein
MKSTFIILVLMLISIPFFAQNTETTEVVDSFKTPQYEVVYDDVFLSKKETKWLFKVDALGMINLNKIYNPTYVNLSVNDFKPRLKIEFEHKLFSNLSINYSAGVIFNNISRYNISKTYNDYVLGIEPRWYFKKKKMDTNGKTINNLNGNYISLNGFHSINDLIENSEYRFTNKTLNWAIIASYGIQKRIFNHTYVDYQIGFGMGRNNLSDNVRFHSLDINYWLHNKFTLGLAFGGGKKSKTNTCDLFRCFEEEKRLWKIDIRNIYKNEGDNLYNISFNPEYEQKIGNSAFSINTGIGLNYRRYKNIYLDYGIKGTFEPRYYYNLKKQIAQGKSANNLSGCYFSIQLSGGYNQFINTFSYRYSTLTDPTINTFDGSEQKDINYTIEPKWGIQKRLFKNGFMDLSFSILKFEKLFRTVEYNINGIITKSNIDNSNEKNFQFLNSDSSIPLPNIYFKIGFAF